MSDKRERISKVKLLERFSFSRGPHPRLPPRGEGITSPSGEVGEATTSRGGEFNSACGQLRLLKDAVKLIKIDRLHQMRQETSPLCFGEIFGHSVAR